MNHSFAPARPSNAQHAETLRALRWEAARLPADAAEGPPLSARLGSWWTRLWGGRAAGPTMVHARRGHTR